METETFGQTLRRLRQQAGLTQTCLAKQVGWSQSQVCRAENDRSLPSADIAKQLDTVLHADGELHQRYHEAVAERQARTTARRAIRPRGPRRRQVIGLAGAAASAALLPAGLARLIAELDTPWPGRVTPSDVAAVEQGIVDLIDRDHRYGGGPIHHMVLGQLRWATSLLGGSFLPGVRQRLHRAIAHLADLAAWTTADVGNVTAAHRLAAFALQHARESGDPGIVVHVASIWSRILTQANNPHAALEVLDLAYRHTRVIPPPAVSMLHVMSALAAARLPDTTACQRHLDLANRAFRPPTGDDPGWLAFFTAAKLAGDTGTALFDLARTSGHWPEDTLTRYLSDAVATYPDSRARSKAVAAARLAAFCYRVDNLDEANQAARLGVRLAHGVRSVQVAESIAILADTAARHQRDAEVQDIVTDAHRILARYPAIQTVRT